MLFHTTLRSKILPLGVDIFFKCRHFLVFRCRHFAMPESIGHMCRYFTKYVLTLQAFFLQLKLTVSRCRHFLCKVSTLDHLSSKSLTTVRRYRHLLPPVSTLIFTVLNRCRHFLSMCRHLASQSLIFTYCLQVSTLKTRCVDTSFSRISSLATNFRCRHFLSRCRHFSPECISLISFSI